MSYPPPTLPPPPPAPPGVHQQASVPMEDVSSVPSKLVYGSLESTLRASGISAANAKDDAPVTVPSSNAGLPKPPVSFNQRSALITGVTHGTEDATGAKPLSDVVRIGMVAGNINISSLSSETFGLSESTMRAKEEQLQMLKEMEIKKKARSVVVPTNDNLVRKRLREIGEPITLFGERIPGRRERLSGLLARRAVEESLASGGVDAERAAAAQAQAVEKALKEKESKAYLTPGTEALKAARQHIARFSITRAAERVARERLQREEENRDPTSHVKGREERLKRLGKLSNFCSEVGDARPVSSVSFSSDSTRLATASWSGVGKVWGLIPQTTMQWELKGHKEPMTDIAWAPVASAPVGTTDQLDKSVSLATCGMDSTVMLWSAPIPDIRSDEKDQTAADTAMTDVVTSGVVPPVVAPFQTPVATLKGHLDRCCRIAWHPSGGYLASTSYDKTWRLWDVTTQQELLKQQGHSKATYAIAFQKDGALAASGDLGGVGHLWDLRTGHSILSLIGHAKQMLACDFHPNGVHLATASDDHTVRIWDLRKQSTLYTIGAHSNLISNVRWDPLEGLYLLTSSYDQTSKIWHGTDFTLLKTLAGHEGRVMRAEIAPNGAFIATSAYDRTWKLFAYDA